eukprot:1159177-Pelagomonas_calceolata.AAC.10
MDEFPNRGWPRSMALASVQLKNTGTYAAVLEYSRTGQGTSSILFFLFFSFLFSLSDWPGDIFDAVQALPIEASQNENNP